MRAHPDDLTFLNGDLHNPQGQTANDCGMVSAFHEVCRTLEPGLVFPDDASRRTWLVNLAELEFKLHTWKQRTTLAEPAVSKIETRVFLTLAELAKSLWRGPSKSAVKELPFVKDSTLRRIAERDYVSLMNARKSDETKTAIILAGSIIETLLLDQIEQRAASVSASAGVVRAKRLKDNPRVWQGFQENAIETWTLYQMVAVCGPDGLSLLSSRTEQTAQTLRDWRNMVHPRVERTEIATGPLGIEDAAVSAALVDMIISQLQSTASP